MARILVLGKTGMLGSMVYRYLSEKMPGEVRGFSRQEFNVLKPWDTEINFYYDYLINCIGIVNKNADLLEMIAVNTAFPHVLARCQRLKIIHPSTDCVFSGEDGYYDEDSPTDAHDNYGKSKALGESTEPNVLNIRCSLIGPGGGLMQWFLDNKNMEIPGYRHAFWNGVTTLQFAQLCHEIIRQDAFDEIRKVNHVHHLVCNGGTDKALLLHHIAVVYGLNPRIVHKFEPTYNRILTTKYDQLEKYCPRKTIYSAIQELKEYDESRHDISLSSDTRISAVS